MSENIKEVFVVFSRGDIMDVRTNLDEILNAYRPLLEGEVIYKFTNGVDVTPTEEG